MDNMWMYVPKEEFMKSYCLDDNLFNEIMKYHHEIITELVDDYPNARVGDLMVRADQPMPIFLQSLHCCGVVFSGTDYIYYFSRNKGGWNIDAKE